MASEMSTQNGNSDVVDLPSESECPSQSVSNNSITNESSSEDIIKLDDSEQFTLSTNGDECSVNESDAQDDKPEEVHCIPKYTTMFTDFLTVQEFSMETGQPVSDARPKRTCFNCLGDHNVPDCKEALNHSRIAQNRRAYQGRKQTSSVRYHELASNKYGHFTPGVLSPALRHALGCRDYQQSELIYRMRLLGYPPGWLMEAREQQGELVLYGSDGRAVAMVDGEEGEVSGTAKYRPEKLIDYPGFNSPLPDHFREESHLYRLPAIQAVHRIDRWREIMNKNKVTPYRKRKLRPNDTDNTASSADLSDDIRLVDSRSSSPDVVQVDKATDRPSSCASKRRIDESPEEGEISSDDESSFSPPKKSKLSDEKASTSAVSGDHSKQNSTIDLTDDSKEAVTADFSSTPFTLDLEPSPVDLECSVEPTDKMSSLKDENNSQSSSTAVKTEASSADEDDVLDPGPPGSSSTPAPALRRTRSHIPAASKGFVLGAVLPKSITPYSSLPHPDKWTVDVTDHILFENLPDSLGAWKNMKDLMKKVKNKVTELHAEED